MTLSSRNNLLNVCFVITVMLLVVFLSAGILIFVNPLHWSLELTQGEYKTISTIAGLLLLITILQLLLKSYFRKTNAPEALFFFMFLFAAAGESLRILHPLQQFLLLPAAYGILITKAIYFTRFFAAFAFFSSGIFAAGLRYQRHEILLGIGVLISLGLSYGLPIDTSTLGADLIYSAGKRGILNISLVFIDVLAVINYLLSAKTLGEPKYVKIALYAAITALGRAFILSGNSWLGIAGLFLLGIGAILYSRELHNVYLWL